MASGGEGSELSIVEISERRLEEFLQGFESQLDIIRRQPKSVKQATCESDDFKFGLHIVVWFLSLNEGLIQNKNVWLKLLKQKLVDDDQETIASMEEKMRDLREHQKQVIRMTDILNRVREVGRGTCVDTAKQARKLDTEIITSIHEDFKSVESSATRYLRSLVSVVSKLDRRNGLCPEWGKLEEKRRMMFHLLDDVPVSESNILMSLNLTSDIFLPEHAEYSCTFYKFHCRYLDEELRNLALYVKARCADDLHLFACQLAANDVELCNIHLRNIDKLGPLNVFPGNFGLRMYRACMRTVSHHVAEKWMKLRFDDDPDKRELVDTLHGTITSLRKIKHVPAERIELNGEHEGVGAQTKYQLPEPKEWENESSSEKPWWVEVFGNRIKGIFPQGPTTPSVTGQTCSSSADTVVLSTERYDSMMRKRSDHDFHSHAGENNAILTDNENSSQKFKHSDNIRDFDIYSINFAIPSLEEENSISLKWSDREGNEQERKTNIRKDVPYHCRVLSYDLLQDEWVITSDFCRVTGVLSVEEKGASCEPLVGDCGFYTRTDGNVFKVHRHPRDHCLREYLSEIRAQCTASFYVDKFSNLTEDRFGCLRMLHIDCLILFANSNRETIIDIMTRERRVEIKDEFKSMIKFDKFTNNTSWKNRGVNTALFEAFTHFSHHESDGVLMVADLQGWVSVERGKVFYSLTDPVIHCPKRTVRFGGTNREEEGIMLFFKKIHPECNDICRELHLKRPPEFDDS